jgi:hypothetical protein
MLRAGTPSISPIVVAIAFSSTLLAVGVRPAAGGRAF